MFYFCCGGNTFVAEKTATKARLVLGGQIAPETSRKHWALAVNCSWVHYIQSVQGKIQVTRHFRRCCLFFHLHIEYINQSKLRYLLILIHV